MAAAMIADFLGHGGRIDAAMRAWPDAPRPWLDLSTGINPVAWVPPANMTVDPAPLPSRAALAALEASAARMFGVAAERVAAVSGSEVALRLLGAMGMPRPIVAPGPGYATHRDVADAREGAGGTLLLANPNNPDGRVIAPADLLAMGDGRWLAVDEAFVDAQPAASVLPLVAADAPVVVLRSFGKFFGLAGVRLGFVVAPAAVLARLRGLLGDWPVSAQAIAWGQAAYADAAWIAWAREELATKARRLDMLLASHGFSLTGDSPLFRLGIHDKARVVFERLARAGVLTRPFADRADWLRFGLPADEAGFERLGRALRGG